MGLAMRHAGSAPDGSEALRTFFGGGAELSPQSTDAIISLTRADVGAIGVARLSVRSGTAAVVSREASGRTLLAVLCITGGGLLHQNGAAASLKGGEIALIGFDRPLSLELKGRHVLVRCPASAVRARRDGWLASRIRPTPSDTGLGSLARSLIVTLSREAGRMTDDDAASVQAIFFDLAARLMDQQASAPEASLPPRIRDVIEAHLADPDVTPARIAQACGTSVRGLYRHFLGMNISVCEWIKQRRLERCREDLQDPRWSNRTITEIAFRWGFNDAAHFSRAFKARYGAPPRALRASFDALVAA